MSNTGWKEDLARDIESYVLGEVPSPFELHRAPVIQEWSTEVRRVAKEFKLVVTGQAKRHPGYADGDLICTPAVFWFDRKARFVRTAQRLYKLGEPTGDEIPVDGVDL